MKGFLRVFQSILHGLEAAATIAAPIVAAVDPVVGGLMNQSVGLAVLLEGTITTPGSGAQKAAIVTQTSAATVGLINSLLGSQGKQPLGSNITEAIAATTKNVVDSLNTVANTVDPQPAK